MCSRQGRKPNVSEDEMLSAIRKRKEEVFIDFESGKLKSKTEDVWKYLSDDLEGKLSARSLYSRMCEGNLRAKVLHAKKIGCEPFHYRKPDISLNETNDTNHSTVEDENSLEFTIFAPNCEYEELLTTKEYKIHKGTKQKHESTRSCFRLEGGRWQEWISNKIWQASTLPCGFNFHGHYLTTDGAAGTLRGMIIQILYFDVFNFIIIKREIICNIFFLAFFPYVASLSGKLNF